jgi:ABC-type phosphate/phosphonate transport system ATPase subunit
VASNLLFGEPAEGHLSENGLPNNDCFMRSLRQAGLLEPLSELGARFGTQILEKFGTLSILLPTIAITRRELGSLKRTLKKFDELSPSELPERHRRKLLGLALHVIPAVHTLVEIPDSLQRQIVAGRKKMMKRLQEETPGAVRFYHPDAYIPKASIIENIIFGRITSENIDVKSRVHEFINRLLVEQELLETIIQIGMTFQVGRSGENLSGGQRQKLALARALLKDPSILLLDEATASLDKQSQRRIQKVLESQWKGKSTTVAVVHRLDIIENYDKIAVMDAGHIKEIGTYDELMATRGLLYRLAGDKSP